MGINPFTKDPPPMGMPPRDLTKTEAETAMAKRTLSYLIFWRYASSPHLEDNLLAARRTMAVTHSLSLAGAVVVLLNSPVGGAVCLAVWLSSLAYLIHAYRRCARVLREDEVRQVMES